jgi:hypothetical protein
VNTSRCTSAIWYFEPYGILTPGPNFIHGKLNPHGILNSLISNQDIKQGVRSTMGRGFKISWEGGSKIPWEISFKILPSQIYSFGGNFATSVTNVWEELVLVSYHRSYISLEGIWQFWYNWTRYCCSIKLEFWSLKKKPSSLS